MKTKLTNPTDDELNAAFAENVAGYVLYRHAMEPPMSSLEVPEKWCYRDRHGTLYLGEPYRLHPAAFDEIGLRWGYMWARPAFTRSMDAVLPWLEKKEVFEVIYNNNPHSGDVGYAVQVADSFTEDNKEPKGRSGWVQNNFLPRACVIALLCAHGVEVEFV